MNKTKKSIMKNLELRTKNKILLEAAMSVTRCTINNAL